MPQRSAGILLYRWKGCGIEVLLVHPGGPFWAKKDAGAWSIPKGVIEPGEDAIAVARREFEEETGQRPEGEFVSLGSFEQSRAKTIEIWAVQGNFDPSELKSNTFTMEWPPRSGRTATFPEADRAQWFTPEEATDKILKGQRPVLATLLERVGAPAVRQDQPARALDARPVARPPAAARSRASSAAGGRQKTSATYKLLRQAILQEKQVMCVYQGKYREICPLIIGHTEGKEKVLVFQFAGETSKGKLRPGAGQWKCFSLAEVRDARLRDGDWHEGGSHKTAQVCVREVDLDINIHVRKLRK